MSCEYSRSDLEQVLSQVSYDKRGLIIATIFFIAIMICGHFLNLLPYIAIAYYVVCLIFIYFESLFRKNMLRNVRQDYESVNHLLKQILTLIGLNLTLTQISKEIHKSKLFCNGAIRILNDLFHFKLEAFYH